MDLLTKIVILEAWSAITGDVKTNKNY